MQVLPLLPCNANNELDTWHGETTSCSIEYGMHALLDFQSKVPSARSRISSRCDCMKLLARL